MNGELVMLASKYEPNKHSPAGMFVSLKLDGQRCIYDGGVSRGLPKVLIPWANQDKDSRYIDPPVCTGLWSRYSNIIHAPGWFLDQLPKGIIMDGELFAGRGMFQEGRSTTSTLVPDDDRWRKISYNIFDLPSIEQLFIDRRINNPNFKKEIVKTKCLELYKDSGVGLTFNRPLPFENVYRQLVSFWQSCGKPKLWKPLTQIKLSEERTAAEAKLELLLDEETKRGGEGLMLRASWSYWTPNRSKQLLKVKRLDDDEGIVIGYVTGQGKLLGMLGAIVVKTQNVTFELSGFTDHERQLIMVDGKDPQSRLREASEWAKRNPGAECPINVVSVQFPLGKKITYRHRGVTESGVPREARYYRFN